jgi:hypothetical protein
MSSIGIITSTTQTVHAAAAIKRVTPATNTAPTRDADGDGDHSPPGGNSIGTPGMGGLIDVYA